MMHAEANTKIILHYATIFHHNWDPKTKSLKGNKFPANDMIVLYDPPTYLTK